MHTLQEEVEFQGHMRLLSRKKLQIKGYVQKYIHTHTHTKKNPKWNRNIKWNTHDREDQWYCQEVKLHHDNRDLASSNKEDRVYLGDKVCNSVQCQLQYTLHDIKKLFVLWIQIQINEKMSIFLCENIKTVQKSIYLSECERERERERYFEDRGSYTPSLHFQ
jgi:adenosyl cobinamide kinase/adenosyl cobinamide phosphate guanylyltransferase